MYKFERYRQHLFADFSQRVGLKMSSENRQVKKVETILWDAIVDRYAKALSSKAGMPAKSLQTALEFGSYGGRDGGKCRDIDPGCDFCRLEPFITESVDFLNGTRENVESNQTVVPVYSNGQKIY